MEDQESTEEVVGSEVSEVATPEVAEEPKPKKAAPKKRKPKTFPVKMLRNYRPIGEFKVVQDIENEEYIAYPKVSTVLKVWEGAIVELPIEEAKSLIDNDVAVRADDLPA